MRIAGALTLVAGVLTGIILALLPPKVVVSGGTVNCGPPIVHLVGGPQGHGESISDFTAAAIEADCRSQSVVRFFIGLFVFAIGTGAGVIMMVAGGGSAEQWWWDGVRWVRL